MCTLTVNYTWIGNHFSCFNVYITSRCVCLHTILPWFPLNHLMLLTDFELISKCYHTCIVYVHVHACTYIIHQHQYNQIQISDQYIFPVHKLILFCILLFKILYSNLSNQILYYTNLNRKHRVCWKILN